MRRKPGRLLPLETSICEVACLLQQGGVTQFHGFSIAKELKHSVGTYSPYSGTGIAFDTPAVAAGKGFQFTNIALGDTRPNSDASAAIAQALMRTLETGRPELFAPAPSERLGR